MKTPPNRLKASGPGRDGWGPVRGGGRQPLGIFSTTVRPRLT